MTHTSQTRLTHRPRTLVAAALFVTLLGASASSVLGYVFLFGSTTRWPDGQVGTRLQLDSWGNGEVKKALSAWNGALDGSGVRFTSNNTSGSPSHNGRNEVAMAKSTYGFTFGSNVLAVAFISRRGSRIVESDVIFNSAFTWGSYRGSRRSGLVDIRRVALYEFGHSLGFGHENSRASIMQSYISNIDRLQADDENGARALYGGGGDDGGGGGGGGGDSCDAETITFGKRVRGKLRDDDCTAPNRRDGRPISTRSPARVVTASTSPWTVDRCQAPT